MKVFLCLAVVLLLATYVNSYSYQQQQQQSYSQPSYNSKSQSYNNKKPSYSKEQAKYLACPGGKEIITSPGGGLPGSCTSNNQCTMSCNAACSKATYAGSTATYDYARFGYCVQKQENKENNKYHSNGYQKQSYSSKRSTSGGYQRQHTTTACKCCCDNYPTCPTSLFNYQLNTTSCNNYMDCTKACNQVSYCGVQNPTACVFTNLVGTCQCCCQPCQTISNPIASPTNLLSSTNPQVMDTVWIKQGELYPAATATSAQTTSYTYTFCSPLQVQVDFTDLNCPSQTYLITVDGSSTRAACTNCQRNCGAAATVTDPDIAFTTAAFATASIGPLAAGVTHTVIVTYPTPPTGAPSHSEGSAIRFTVRPGQLCPGNPVCPN